MVSAGWGSTGWPSFYNTSAVPERIDIIQFPSATNIDSAPPLSHCNFRLPHPYRNCCYDKTTSLDDAAIVVLEFRHYHVLVTRGLSSSSPPLHSHPDDGPRRAHPLPSRPTPLVAAHSYVTSPSRDNPNRLFLLLPAASITSANL